MGGVGGGRKEGMYQRRKRKRRRGGGQRKMKKKKKKGTNEKRRKVGRKRLPRGRSVNQPAQPIRAVFATRTITSCLFCVTLF